MQVFEGHNNDKLVKSLLRAILATSGKKIHTMLSVKIATLEGYAYVFFCQMPKTKARSGAFQKGAIRQVHGPEQSRRTYVRSNPDFIGTVNV